MLPSRFHRTLEPFLHLQISSARPICLFVNSLLGDLPNLLIRKTKFTLVLLVTYLHRLIEFQMNGDQALFFNSLLLRDQQTIGMETVAHSNDSVTVLH